MKKPVLYLNDKQKGEYRVVINAIEDWEGFEKLAEYLKVNYHAELVDSFDGPDARKWIFLANGKKIELIHSDGYGNYLTSTVSDGVVLINEIGKDLEKRLRAT